MIIWFSQMKICLNSFGRNTIDYSMETKVTLSWGGVRLTLLCEKVKVILFSTRDNIMLYSFFLNQGFVPLGFPGKVFNEATLIIIVYSFSFTEFLSQWVFLSKVLMRHNNMLWTSKGECYEYCDYMDVHTSTNSWLFLFSITSLMKCLEELLLS